MIYRELNKINPHIHEKVICQFFVRQLQTRIRLSMKKVPTQVLIAISRHFCRKKERILDPIKANQEKKHKYLLEISNVKVKF